MTRDERIGAATEMIKLSKLERSLISFARAEFGEHLTQFLLAGLGEEETTHSWLFTIDFTHDGTSLHRELQVSDNDHPEAPTRLPERRDPLVILALLRLLILQDQPSSSNLSSANLSYKIEEVLKLLGWKDTARSRRMIDEAVERYSKLMYRWAMGADELAIRGLAFYNSMERFVSGFSRVDQESKDGKQLIRVSNRIEFSKEFVEGMRKRSLFQIDWNRIISITHA